MLSAVPEPLKRAYWKTLLTVAPSEYEKQKAVRLGFAYPEYFDATQSIFIHVPKTAGTSIGMALYGRQIPHRTWRDWRNLNPRKFNRYFKFAVMREPIARFQSAFGYLKQGGCCDTERDFADTVLRPFANINELARAMIDVGLQQRILSWEAFRPQCDFVADPLGTPQVDLLLRYENIARGFEQVADRLNCGTVRLPRLNATHWERETVDHDAREILDCLFRKDFMLWETYAT